MLAALLKGTCLPIPQLNVNQCDGTPTVRGSAASVRRLFEPQCWQYFRFVKTWRAGTGSNLCLLTAGQQRGTPAFTATGTSGCQTRFGPFLDQATFELGECGEDVEDQLA